MNIFEIGGRLVINIEFVKSNYQILTGDEIFLSYPKCYRLLVRLLNCIMALLSFQLMKGDHHDSPNESVSSSKKTSGKSMKLKESKNIKKNIKRKRIFLTIGFILIILGIIIGFTLPSYIIKTPQQMQEDADYNERGWRSYEPEDEVIIKGRITYEKKIFKQNGEEDFGYIIDNLIKLISKEDIGNNGDIILLKCKVKEMSDPSVNNGTPFEYLEAKSEVEPILYYLPGIIFLILGQIFILIGIFKFSKKRYTQKKKNEHLMQKQGFEKKMKNVMAMSTENNLVFNIDPGGNKDIPIIKFKINNKCKLENPYFEPKDADNEIIKTYGKLVKFTPTKSRSWIIFKYYPTGFTRKYNKIINKDDIIEFYIEEKEKIDPSRSKFELYLRIS